MWADGAPYRHPASPASRGPRAERRSMGPCCAGSWPNRKNVRPPTSGGPNVEERRSAKTPHPRGFALRIGSPGRCLRCSVALVTHKARGSHSCGGVSRNPELKPHATWLRSVLQCTACQPILFLSNFSSGLRMRCSSLLAVLVWQALPVCSAEAQTTQPSVQAARSITAVDIARRIGVIADDSILGRDTPSRGLELTAEYVAAQFRRFGLQTSIQRYPITRRRLQPAQSRVVFSAGGREESASFMNAAVFQSGVVPEQPIRSTAILVGGAQTTESAGGLDVRNKMILFVPPAKPDPEALQQVLRVLLLAESRALIILSDIDSAAFAASIPRRQPERTVIASS